MFKFLPNMERVGLRGESRAVLLFFILIPGGIQTSLLDKKDLYINYTIRTWEDASRSCNLVGSYRSPSYVNVKDIPVVQDKSGGGTPHTESLYWIGATATFTPWFELLGCQKLAPVNSMHMHNLTNRSLFIGPVADCYMKCGSHFGVNATHCYCAKLGQGKLNASCELTSADHFPVDIIGNKTSDNFFHHLAIYEVLDSTVDFEDELGECLIHTTTGKMTTRPCDVLDRSNRTWTDSVLAGLPLRRNGPEYWTQLTRRRLVQWTKDNATACATVREAHHEYEILLRPCDEPHAYICQRKPDSKNEVSPCSHHMTTPSPFVTSREKTDTTANIHVIATTTVTDSLLPNTENERSLLPLIVGSVIGGSVFLLIIVVIVFINRKRHGHSKKKSILAATDNIYYSDLAEHHDEGRPLQGTTPSSADDIMTSDGTKDLDQLVHGGEDGVYNHTWDRPIAEQQTDHVYSSSNAGNEYDCVNNDVYNHTWDKPITEEITDHVYSSTISGNDVNVYDHSKPRNLTDSNGDEYGVISS